MSFRYVRNEAHQKEVEAECLRRIKRKLRELRARYPRLVADTFDEGFACGVLLTALRAGRPELARAIPPTDLGILPHEEFRAAVLEEIGKIEVMLRARRATA